MAVHEFRSAAFDAKILLLGRQPAIQRDDPAAIGRRAKFVQKSGREAGIQRCTVFRHGVLDDHMDVVFYRTHNMCRTRVESLFCVENETTTEHVDFVQKLERRPILILYIYCPKKLIMDRFV